MKSCLEIIFQKKKTLKIFTSRIFVIRYTLSRKVTIPENIFQKNTLPINSCRKIFNIFSFGIHTHATHRWKVFQNKILLQKKNFLREKMTYRNSFASKKVSKKRLIIIYFAYFSETKNYSRNTYQSYKCIRNYFQKKIRRRFSRGKSTKNALW